MHKDCTQIKNDKRVKRIYYNSTVINTVSEFPFNSIPSVDDLKNLKVNLALYKEKLENQYQKCLQYLKTPTITQTLTKNTTETITLPVNTVTVAQQSINSSSNVLREIVLENMDKHSKDTLIKYFNKLGLRVNEANGENETIIAIDIAPISKNKNELDNFLTFLDDIKEYHKKKQKINFSSSSNLFNNLNKFIDEDVKTNKLQMNENDHHLNEIHNIKNNELHNVKKINVNNDLAKSSDNLKNLNCINLIKNKSKHELTKNHCLKKDSDNFFKTLISSRQSLAQNAGDKTKEKKKKTKKEKKNYILNFFKFFYNLNNKKNIKVNDKVIKKKKKNDDIFNCDDNGDDDNNKEILAYAVDTTENPKKKISISFSPSVAFVDKTNLSIDKDLPNDWDDELSEADLDAKIIDNWGRKIRSESVRELKLIDETLPQPQPQLYDQIPEVPYLPQMSYINIGSQSRSSQHLPVYNDPICRPQPGMLEPQKMQCINRIIQEQQTIKQTIENIEIKLQTMEYVKRRKSNDKHLPKCSKCGERHSKCAPSQQWSSQATKSDQICGKDDVCGRDSMTDVPHSFCWCSEFCEKLKNICYQYSTKSKTTKNLENELEYQKKELRKLNNLLDIYVGMASRN